MTPECGDFMDESITANVMQGVFFTSCVYVGMYAEFFW